ncbi:MAG: SDR family NAD(P)-dependent oxidoreductase [Clostridiales bacterium]|nr:SDR family NAD(P)-dependent oxidoreductase [Clostridiales bacterium]
MKNIVIIGGSSGIGLSLAQKLTENGENVYCISKSICPIDGVNNSVTDVRDIDRLNEHIQKINHIDALVYCAGISLASSVEYAEEEIIEELIDVNLTCAILAVKAALSKMSDGGRIILLSSSGGVAPIAFDAPYSASKAGLIKLAEALDLELSHIGIKCTAAVIPGVRTRFSFKRKIFDSEKQLRYADKLKNAADALIKIEQTGATADYISDKLLKILDGKSPPPVVIVGAKNKIGMFVYRILPHCLKRKILRFIYKI